MNSDTFPVKELGLNIQINKATLIRRNFHKEFKPKVTK